MPIRSSLAARSLRADFCAAVLCAALLPGCGGSETDTPAPGPDGGVASALCDDPSWTAGACMPGSARAVPGEGASHVDESEVITWQAVPPASGPHRGQWARWGEYSELGPERWLHNLEHGGIALLYNPCIDPESVEALRAIARGMPDDDTGAFRWILTPYPELPSAVAVVAWEWVYEAECVQADEIETFIGQRYRRAPEDVRGDGAYSENWIGR